MIFRVIHHGTLAIFKLMTGPNPRISQFILVSFTSNIWAALGLGYILDQVEACLGSPLLLTSLVRYTWDPGLGNPYP